jgi:exonuclease VII large subunit
LQELGQRAQRAARMQSMRADASLQAMQQRLHALDPRRVLARGYALALSCVGLA